MSEYKELVKDFNVMRDALRNFFVFGDMSRSEDTKKSARSYDNELRRIKSWLRDIVKCQTVDGEKHYCINVDPSVTNSNPFYAAYKSKSFTQTDINLHFAILYLLRNQELPLSAISKEIDSLLNDEVIDTQTIRIKLNEYAELGILETRKVKNALYYKLADTSINELIENNPSILDAIKFFSETVPIPVIGSYILDNYPAKESNIVFRNYFLANCLDDIIQIDVLKAMLKDCFITVKNHSLNTGQESELKLFPLKIFVSTNTGRRYIIGIIEGRNKLICLRLDFLRKISINEKCTEAENYRRKFTEILPNCFTIAAYQKSFLENFEMTLSIDEEMEKYLLLRLEHEGRNGRVTKVAPNTFVYQISVYDTKELLPWVKSFIGNIIKIKGDNQMAINSFYYDLESMAKQYEI